ncbi:MULTISPECIES: hypothetical protein [Morganellaceae]|uniref:hypothetical protein n=1 Tax=Morganellaceae TaxID=1903414 RepID=UPI0002833206|nr:hypothetical protein [Proteus mirabilis]EKB01229.1 hypothetical protein HMPREF1311_00759 [Proteus mirabilis WGLW6]MDC9752478.1 hypothetical protein [Proteus mirabilis]MDM3613571.1 hypothetical protein [Proteus mirabilis]HCD1179021.1 hypothetical protein [Proteus mirabilis]HEJ9702768.1 hypothetical protein [Proteus mirabilis]
MINLKMYEFLRNDGTRIFFNKESISSIEEGAWSDGKLMTKLTLNCGTTIMDLVPLDEFLKMHHIVIEKLDP